MTISFLSILPPDAPTDNRISGRKLDLSNLPPIENPANANLRVKRHNGLNKAFFPLIFGLVAMLLVEIIIALPVVQKRLDYLVINPLPTKLEQVKTFATDAKATGKPMVLAMGSSRTYDGFAPKAFEQAVQDVTTEEVTAYNMGLPEAGYDVMLLYLKYHVAQYGKPKMLMLETTDFLFDRRLTRSIYYYPSLFAKQPALAWDALSYPVFDMDERQNLALASVSGLFRYRKALSPYMLPKVLLGKVGTGENENPVSKDGWEHLLHSDMLDTPDSLWISNTKTFLPVDTRELELILDYCKEQGIQVVLVDWPDMSPYRKLALDSDLYAGYEEAIDSVAQKYHVRHVNFNDEPGASDKINFTDIRHLNPEHAEYFTRLLGEEAVAGIQ